MKTRKSSKIAQAIEDSVFAQAHSEIVEDANDDTGAKVVEQDDDFDEDIFMKDFSAEKPSKLRALNASRLDQDGSQRYKGKKVSRKDLEKPDLDGDLFEEEDSDDDEEEEVIEHAKAELGHMFEMEGVEYDDDDEEKAYLAKKNRKFRPTKSLIEEEIEDDNDFGNDEDDLSEDEDDMPEYVQNLQTMAENKQEESVLYEESVASSEEDEDSEDDNGKFKDQVKKLKDLKKSSVDEVLDDDQNVSDDEENSDEDQDDGMGPDLSDMLESKSKEVDEDDNIATFSSSNVEKEVSKGKAIIKQQQIWDGLLELRISMQKALTRVNQLPQNEDWKTFKAALNDDDLDVKKCQLHLAKILDQLMHLRSVMLSKNSVLDQVPPVVGKKRKLNDYDKCLESNFEALTDWRNSTLEDWNDRTRIAANDKGFSGFETSVVKQIDHILADKSRLVKRTKLRRTAYDILGQESNDQDDDHNDEIFDDDDFYHQLLRELIERKTAGISDPIALGQQWVKLQKVRAKAKKMVDTKASKGRKTRFDIHAKLVNFMAPAYPMSTISEEAKTELFGSLFKGYK